jgi:hypothetical protein
LQSDAARLRALPRRKPPADFAERLQQTVHQQSITPATILATVRKGRPNFAWAKLGAAAALVVAVTVGAYWLYGRRVLTRHELAQNTHGQTETQTEPQVAMSKDLAGSGLKPIAQNAPSFQMQTATGEKKQASAVQDRLANKKESMAASPPLPAPHSAPVIQSPVEVSLKDLEQAEGQKRLLDQVQNQGAYRIDLVCQENDKAFDQLTSAIRSSGFLITPLADKAGKLGAGYCLYTEDLSSAELASIIRQLTPEPSLKSRGKTAITNTIQSISVAPMKLETQQSLGGLLQDAKLSSQDDAKEQGDLRAFVPRSRTSRRAGAEKAGQGGSPLAAAAKSQAAPNRRAVILTPQQLEKAAASQAANGLQQNRSQAPSNGRPILWVVRTLQQSPQSDHK